MRRWIVLAAVALGVVTLSVAAGAADKKMPMAKPVTIEGTLIDTKCYSMSAVNKTNDHMTPDGTKVACAAACAKMGIPVALLTSKGEVVVILAPAPVFKDHMAHLARVTGVKAYKGTAIVPDKTEVKGEDGTWIEISTREMM